MNQITQRLGIDILPPETRNPDGLIRPDAMYTMRHAAAFTRLPQPALRELLERAGIVPVMLKGREYLFGAAILQALETVR